MKFEVKIVNGAAGVGVLELEAADAPAARAEAGRRGLVVLAVSCRGSFARRQGRGGFVLLVFAEQLQALLAAGLGVVEALQALAENEGDSPGGRVIQRVQARLSEGQTLSQAISEQAEFPGFFVAVVRSSERTGQLAPSLARFVNYQRQVDRLKGQIIGACVYPAIVIAVGLLVTAFLMVYVVPRFSQVFQDTGGQMPFASRLLIIWGTAMRDHAWAMLGGVAAALAAAWAWLRDPERRRRALAPLLSSGTVGERLRLFHLARYYRTLGMLVQGGLPVVEAMGMSEHVLPQALRGPASGARESVTQGQPFSTAMVRSGLSSALAARMVAAGERSGAIGEMLERVADFLDEDNARALNLFTRVFEPLLMICIGGLVGLIVVLMYLPIFQLADSIR
jgi:general secretion pathway protein F